MRLLTRLQFLRTVITPGETTFGPPTSTVDVYSPDGEFCPVCKTPVNNDGLDIITPLAAATLRVCSRCSTVFRRKE